MTSDIDKSRKVNVTATNMSLGSFVTEADGDFNLKGDDDAWGYNLGVLYKITEEHIIAASYRSDMKFKYKGTLSMKNLGADATAALFGNSYSTDVKSSLTIPQSIAVGYAYKPNDRLTLEFDVEWTGWSSVEQDLVEWTNETNATRLAVLNADNPGAKDWNDVFSCGLGINYKATDVLDLRCGYFFEETPVPEANFDTALPDADRHGLSCGLGYRFKDVDIDIAYLALFFMDRDITNSVGATSGANIDGKYEQFVNIFSIGFTYRY